MAGGPPAISAAFGASNVALNGTTSLTFSITNPNAVAVTGVGFSDSLPAGMTIAAGSNPANTCSGNAIATPGAATLSLASGSIAAGGTCTLAVNVTFAAPGVQTDTTSAVTATETGPGNTASVSIGVVGPPSLSATFGAAAIGLNGTTSLTFSIAGGCGGAFPITGIAFSDTLPAGLVVATPNGLTNTCQGGVSAPAGGSTISLSAGSAGVSSVQPRRVRDLVPGRAPTDCSIALNVTGVSSGVFINTTSAISSTTGGVGSSASASLTVTAPDLTIASSHSGSFIQRQTGVYTLMISNSGASRTAGAVMASDALPPGLTATAVSGAGWSCKLAPLSCTRSDVLEAGASYPAIKLNVNVSANAAASVTNTAAVSGGGETNTANDRSGDVTAIQPVVDVSVSADRLAFWVDGTSYNAAQSLVWMVGSTHTIATATQPGPEGQGTQYVFTSWSDGGAASHTLIAPPAAASYVANFNRQYSLIVNVYPQTGGTVTPGSGFFNEGSLVKISATPAAGYFFTGFSAGLTGTTPSQTITMTQSVLVQAAFSLQAAVVAAMSPSGSAPTGASFTQPLAVKVTDVTGSALPGVAVLFSAPGAGPSAILPQAVATTNAQGVAGVTAVANNLVGSYVVTASVGSASAVFTLSNTLLVMPPAITAVMPAPNCKTGLAAGELLTLYGANLSDQVAVADATPLPTTLGVTTLLVNGTAVPLLYVDSSQINFQAPSDVAGEKISVVVQRNGQSSQPYMVTFNGPSPAIFLAGGTDALAGGTHAAATNGDGSANSPDNPAPAGKAVVMYATGLGPVTSPVLDGQAAPLIAPWSMVLNPLSATIGGLSADVLFAGLAPGFVGLYQVNLAVPALATGDYPVIVTVGNVPSNAAIISVTANGKAS